ncbi:hypothetical protein ACFU5O_28160 [Streptomyces sp. NPDC057445]|uniref:hypothetical protein n=1 Tax=Streptomyces sp. NPDC057445 TaxID=3346136 RepID=UPI00367976F4
MAEPDAQKAPWTERMEHLKDSAQQRVLATPMPASLMKELLQGGKAVELGRFESSPVLYLDRWWRQGDLGWVALDEDASAQLDSLAERYRAATTPPADRNGEGVAEQAAAEARSAPLPVLPGQGAA